MTRWLRAVILIKRLKRLLSEGIVARSDSSRRQRVLNAAVRVFAEYGLKGATTRRLGAAAGVNSALIYYYFEDKQALFRESIQMVVGQFLEYLRQTQRPFRSARDRLTYLADGVFDYYSAHPDRMRLISVALALHADLFGQTLNAVLREGMPLPLQVLEEGMRRRQLRRLHPIQAWWNVIGLCLFSLEAESVVTHVKAGAWPGPLPDAGARRRQIVDLLLRGMAREDRRTTRRKPS